MLVFGVAEDENERSINNRTILKKKFAQISFSKQLWHFHALHSKI